MKGDEIHYYSRISRILDEFEIRMSKITGNDSHSAFDVLQNMVKGMAGSFDKEILKNFVDFLQVSACEESDELQHKVVELVK